MKKIKRGVNVYMDIQSIWNKLNDAQKDFARDLMRNHGVGVKCSIIHAWLMVD